ncbi:hypothetical protein QBC34DRAFT_381298 [Podospora aff. communis PSN243]|uniref:Uncharacterized protein n=1 Tax=Podospora aff. communis PSN243 TaxID=3040156 RepID=A0AAV9GIT4_9PEZI|nr:hypothetical protein QBC34DRAFT_381298 [Podospora aff. communis PSN243]
MHHRLPVRLEQREGQGANGRPVGFIILFVFAVLAFVAVVGCLVTAILRRRTKRNIVQEQIASRWTGHWQRKNANLNMVAGPQQTGGTQPTSAAPESPERPQQNTAAMPLDSNITHQQQPPLEGYFAPPANTTAAPQSIPGRALYA